MKHPALLIGLLLVVLVSCREEEAGPFMVPPWQEEEALETVPGEDAENLAEAEALSGPAAFFMEAGTVAHFEGEGNEFAAFTLRTEQLGNNYMATYEANGGTTMLRVYRLTADRIELIKEEEGVTGGYKPAPDELEQLEAKSTVLAFPLEPGKVFGDWTVIGTAVTVETPYDTFNNAVLLENKGADKSVVRKYFAEGFGEVKREFYMKEGEAVTVVSALTSIE